MSIDAVALVRIPEWQPSDDLDVRELDDGALIFLDVPFESDPDTIFDALEAAVGEEFYDHEDDRGILVFPDAAEPEAADSYEAVVNAVGEAGVWLSLDTPPHSEAPNPEAILGQLLEAMGGGSADDLVRALREGDEDALKLAQIQMTGAMEKAFKTDPDSEPDGGDKKS